MRILRPIVQALMLAMLNVKLHFPARRGVGLEFVGDHDAGRPSGGFQSRLIAQIRARHRLRPPKSP